MNDLVPTDKSKKIFPSTGMQWFIQMPPGQYELLRLITQSNAKIEPNLVFEIYKKSVSRVPEVKTKNFKNWLMRSIGNLVLRGFLKIKSNVKSDTFAMMDLIRQEPLLNQQTEGR